jgi:hypothetical protein
MPSNKNGKRLFVSVFSTKGKNLTKVFFNPEMSGIELLPESILA